MSSGRSFRNHETCEVVAENGKIRSPKLGIKLPHMTVYGMLQWVMKFISMEGLHSSEIPDGGKWY